ncbi:sterol desaturase/sphingolipid hydroxylase (fatty acid hydroxylase superfamily) [Janthinobacterium sp. 67]|uniref:sterol desaturase family protein n=1 Tax=Janthinobacterium sp. 67 TaxID=2035207 RepID=UPI000C235042|nr:sterol desaturase family protein [Janthinobacterium sp. 67]PJJ21041.1 sterol desaturase/sphingolipid hydroxylase (fatty acid hydroxylase superfamily) [Janthinobacterium sp. 67]
MKSLFAALYGPVFWAGFIGAAACLIAACDHSLWVLPPLLLLALLTSFLAERYLPYDGAWNDGHGDGWRDSLHALVNEALYLLGLAAFPLLAGHLALGAFWPAQLPFWAQLLLAILIADCGITLVHYLSHRYYFLWKLHAVHHSVRRMYGFNGWMKHPLHLLLEATGGMLPLLLLGVPEKVMAVLAFAVAIQLLLQHANVDMRMGPLRHVFAWAPLHRFHHMKYGTAGDVNFGLFFTCWDRLLGTAFEAPGYRMRGEDLGIGSRPDYPVAYGPQLLEPFRAEEGVRAPELPAGLRQALNRAINRAA